MNSKVKIFVLLNFRSNKIIYSRTPIENNSILDIFINVIFSFSENRNAFTEHTTFGLHQQI